MRSYIKLSVLFVSALLLFAFSACEKDQAIISSTDAVQQETELEQAFAVEDVNHIHEEGLGYEEALLDHIEGHGVNLDMIEEVEVPRPDGTIESGYMVGGDIMMSKEELNNLMQGIQNGEKQYRTNNLVASPQTVTVIGYTGGSYALTSKMRTALSWAINNYNALNIGLNFSLSYSSSTNADIVVYRNFQNSGAGGSAGFPSNGNPYKWVQIYAGMQNYNTNVNEHVMTHEIGHCLGMRHTDYFNRASCGQNSNEGSAGVGAVHIPGTPTGYDSNSIMLACFNSSEDGEFGFYDRVAFEFLY